MSDQRPSSHLEQTVEHELEAALAVRQELGEHYEPALAESFVARIESQIDARVDARVAQTVRASRLEAQQQKQQMVLGIVSLGTGIPITAVAGGVGDLPGIVVAWFGIVAVNVAHALRGRGRSVR
jgi:hypothetical protein